ncbi:MAG TPA: glutamine synthetase [Bacteroidales bacterium]|nr:MAG: glutamine synthetase [Bacteroidetes bacterium GWE2_42_24]OFY32729.1 MAG: glutamine synthetase [Bacteroidetes bacterium GWF2_43_11]HAQ66049.1 glutamine synthetase [Bacteroidales bacterium]HBZ65255.1 glutamine synthetase [Bacteroidales bacterium]
MSKNTSMNPNPLVQYLNKPAEEFTKADIIKYIEDNNVEMINFRYASIDGRLKTLNFVITSREHLETILTCGERVDGSSLFKHIEAGSSDLYVIPRFKTAFLNPFTKIPSIDILCAFYNKDGAPLDSAPAYILQKAHNVLKERTGYSFEVMGELEYYIISKKDDLFLADDQRGYHESEPFAKWAEFRRDAMLYIAQTGGLIKYGHSEVGNFTLGDMVYEQNEIEFLPTTLEDAADQLLIAKWILRQLAYRHGVTVTFAPKITVGKAGSGMHIHTRLMKDGRNAMIDNRKLSDVAKKAIAGYLDLAPSLTAFGNMNPTSYFRLVPHQEAPTNICWGDRNRSVLVRVPLGWTGKANMIKDVNPLESDEQFDHSMKQTVEFRCPDGSADVYLLLAGLTVAARHGIEMTNALEYAEKRYVDVNIFDEAYKERLSSLEQLPVCCADSADQLERQANIYMEYDVFPKSMIDGVIKLLKSFGDSNLRQEIAGNNEAILSLVNKYFHCG